MNQFKTFLNSPVKASRIIGTDVVDPGGENLGDIKEVVIDPNTGRVAYVVVSFGGFLSVGEKLFAIPFGAFEYNPGSGAYVLDISKQRLEAAPGFSPDNWPSMAEEQWHRDISKYYEHPPYWE